MDSLPMQNAGSNLLAPSSAVTLSADGKACFLEALPRELLSKICQEAVGTGNKRDTTALASMARTCRILNDVATAILYRDIHRVRDPTKSCYFSDLSTVRKDAYLLATLQNNQALGPLIRTMELTPTSSYIVLDRYLHPDITKGVRLAIAKLFGNGPEVSDKCNSLIPYMALVCSAPRLTKLTLGLHFTWEDTDFLLHKQDGLLKGTKVTFPYLTDLTIHSPVGRLNPIDLGVDLQSINGLLHCTPRLTTLAIEFAKGGTSMTARLEHLTTLKLDKTHLCARGLANLTSACHNLVKFELSHDTERHGFEPSHFDSRPGFLPISPGQVLDCLAPAKQTLQRLFLTTWLPNTPLPGDKFRLLDTLGDFTALRKVSLDYPAIVLSSDNFDTLVGLLKGLEELEVLLLSAVDGSVRFEQEFERFLQAVRIPEWPRLKTVVLLVWEHRGKWKESGVWEGFVSRLQAMMKAHCDGGAFDGELVASLGSVVAVHFGESK